MPLYKLRTPATIRAVKFTYSDEGLLAVKDFLGHQQWLNFVEYGKDRHMSAKGWIKIKRTVFEEPCYIVDMNGEYLQMDVKSFEEDYEDSEN